MNLIEVNWWGLFPVVSQPCVCVCRLHRLVAQTVSTRHLVNCPVHNVIGVFRQPRDCATMRSFTVSTIPIGARSVGLASSPPPTLDDTWQSTPACVTTSVMSVLRSFAVRGAWNDISAVVIRNAGLFVDAQFSVVTLGLEAPCNCCCWSVPRISDQLLWKLNTSLCAVRDECDSFLIIFYVLPHDVWRNL